MADRPILFSSPMVRALIAGTKTQTRRVMKVRANLTLGDVIAQGEHREGMIHVSREQLQEPRIAVGDRLYVREHWFTWGIFDDLAPSKLTGKEGVSYIADQHEGPRPGKFRQGMHMPRWASRITLIVTDVRVERLQDISDADCLAEGVPREMEEKQHRKCFKGEAKAVDKRLGLISHYGWQYAKIWKAINGPSSWDANPWVAAYTFTVAMGNINALARAA